MAMSRGDPIIMRRCSGFRLAVEASLEMENSVHEPTGENVVINVGWSEKFGDKEMFISERWSCIQPNMWLVTSLKK